MGVMIRSGVVVVLLAGVAHAAPVVVQRQSVRIQAVTFHDADYVPKIDLVLVGEPTGAVTATFTRPDGTVWGTAELRVDGGDDRHVHPASNGMLDPDKLSGTFTGPMKVTVNDGKTALFTGQFTVSQPKPGKFVVDHAWLTEVAQLWFDAGQHPDNASLQVAVWLQGHDVDCNDVSATLTGGGATATASEKSMVDSLRSTGDLTEARWIQCRLAFETVKPWVNGDYGDQAKAWLDLSRKPGAYTLVVSRADKAIRTIKLTVDRSGQLAKTGPVEAARRDYRMLVGTSTFYGVASTDSGLAPLYAARKK